jgi:GNAT superfamily N-acetyltransferase
LALAGSWWPGPGGSVVGLPFSSSRPIDRGEIELKNMAVREDLQGRGIGGQLVRAAIELVAGEAASSVLVAYRCRGHQQPPVLSTAGLPDADRSNGMPSPRRPGTRRASSSTVSRCATGSGWTTRSRRERRGAATRHLS